MRQKQTSVNIFWTSVVVVLTGLPLALTGCSPKESAKVEAGEMGEPMAGPPKEAVTVSYSNAISSLELTLATQNLDPVQERDLLKLMSDMKENAASRARYEKRQ